MRKLGSDDGAIEPMAVVDLFSGFKLLDGLRFAPDEKPGTGEDGSESP